MISVGIISIILFSTSFVVAETLKRQRFNYPELRRDDTVIDDYYGITVPDPYRYLEDPTSEEVKTFIKEQNKLTDDYLDGNSIKKMIEKRVTEVYNYPKYGVPERHGSKYYTTMNTGLQNQDVYYVQDELRDEEPRVFFDPNTLSIDGTVHLSKMSFSEDGQLVALGLSSKGSDWVTARFRNTSSREDFPETLQNIKFSEIVWSKDGAGIFYACYPHLSTNESTGTETSKYGNQKMYYHRVGTNQTEDVLLLEFEDPEMLIGYFDITDDGKHLIIFPNNGGGHMVYFASLDEQLKSGGIRSKLTVTPIVDHMKYIYYYIGSEGSVVYLLTNDEAPNYRLVGIDLNNPDPTNWTTIVPEHKDKILDSVDLVDTDKFVLMYVVDVKNQLEVRSLNGSLIQHIDIPFGSTENSWGKKSHNELFFLLESFLTPGILYRVDLSHKPYIPEVVKEIKVPGFNAAKFVTTQVFYPSFDGTKIPMYIVHKQELVRNGSASTFLYGYGGFGASILPSFDSSRIVFIQNFDGVYAVANIRGGGEYGSTWHEGGLLLNKQNSFDDFQAAAKYLVQEKYTTASKIAINGISNGGSLVAACVNQRPELFGAAVAEVGAYDLLRSHKFTNGYDACPEYGCSDDGNQTIFENLYRLSPLHNVRLPVDETVQYPSVLLTTGDHDDRVSPLHSYKLIAELQFKIGGDQRQTNPLMIRIKASTGHCCGKPTTYKIAESTEIYTFLAESTGFTFKP